MIQGGVNQSRTCTTKRRQLSTSGHPHTHLLSLSHTHVHFSFCSSPPPSHFDPTFHQPQSPMSDQKKRVCYFYDGILQFLYYWIPVSCPQIEVGKWARMRCTLLSHILFSQCRQLPLWSWSSHEAPSHQNVSRIGYELWPIQENGNLCMCVLLHVPLWDNMVLTVTIPPPLVP